MKNTYYMFAPLALAAFFASCNPSAQEKAVTDQSSIESQAMARQKAEELKNYRIDSTVQAIKAIKGPGTLHSEYYIDGSEILVAADNSTYAPVGNLTNIPSAPIEKK